VRWLTHLAVSETQFLCQTFPGAGSQVSLFLVLSLEAGQLLCSEDGACGARLSLLVMLLLLLALLVMLLLLSLLLLVRLMMPII
jgi:hypothetical protein